MDVRTLGAALLAVCLASCSGGLYETSDFMTANQRGKAGAGKVDPTATTASVDGAATEPAKAGDAAAAPKETAASAAAPAKSSGGLLAMFRMGQADAQELPAVAAANAEAAPDADTAAEARTAAVPEPDVEEVSEAELAGETEADPTEIPPPEEPIDDGEKHDFVNVYTSRPDKPVETVEGLPGVTWEGGIVFASRTPDDPSFFGGDHPFARSVPGVPRQAIQAANGLLLAHSAINVSCLKPNLLNLIRRAESHFGKKVIVTSGYRSPTHNRRVRGALHSQHLYCNALDLYMPGIARDDLAKYFFAQPDRGGIGLYCHTRSIHVDTGRKRQWRWPCRRKVG